MSVAPLFISDLDGTLLDREGRLAETSRRRLVRLFESGVLFTVASARSHFSIRSIFGDVPFPLPIIEFNGAFITDYATGTHLQINALDEELGHAVLDFILEAGLSPFVSSYDGCEDRLHYEELTNPGMRWYEERRRLARDPRLRQTRNLRSLFCEQVVSLTVMDESEAKIRRLEETLACHLGPRLRMYLYENEYSRGTWWLTVHERAASKHVAMHALRDQFAAGSAIFAFGDNLNDVDMLRTAERGIAVQNAVPRLKAVADEIIGPNVEDSVVSYLERFLAGEVA